MAESNKRRLLAVLALTATYMGVEVLAAIVTNSLSLLSDAGHMFADSAGLGLSYMAISYASRPATPGKTYGYHRLEILAAFVNGIILVLISGYILYEGFSRLVDPPKVLTLGMLAVAVVGLALNLASLLILRGPSS
ncbi:MAG: cation diffusion facilitator family transporter, partial [Candidatus Geothermarchaeales archaeon]